MQLQYLGHDDDLIAREVKGFYCFPKDNLGCAIGIHLMNR